MSLAGNLLVPQTKKTSATLKEPPPIYIMANDEPSPLIFGKTELDWLETYLGPVPKSLFNEQDDNT